MTNRARMNSLQKVTELKFEIVQLDMAQILSHEIALRKNLEQLVRQKHSQAQTVRAHDDPALLANADIRWHQWVDQRRAFINDELAKILARKAECQIKLQQAFGKDKAVQTLLKRANAQARQVALRRDNYES